MRWSHSDLIFISVIMNYDKHFCICLLSIYLLWKSVYLTPICGWGCWSFHFNFYECFMDFVYQSPIWWCIVWKSPIQLDTILFGFVPHLEMLRLLLDFHSGITPGRAWGTIWDTRDQIWVAACKVSILPTVLSLQHLSITSFYYNLFAVQFFKSY